MRVNILRQPFPGAEPYWETFEYDGPSDNTVAGLLDCLNELEVLKNTEGEKTGRIGWECSCLEGLCGSCAMVINGAPALACEVFLKDLKGEELTIRPLQKFPVIKDLLVDRSSIHEHLKNERVYIEEYQPSKKAYKEIGHQYTAAKCLKCGLCLEVCPNYVSGQSFYGAVFANDCYLVATRNREKSKDMKRAYDRHVGNSCSKSLSCADVCPAEIPALATLSRMNRGKR